MEKNQENLADKIVWFCGSWNFLVIFFVFIFVWMILISFILLSHAFDSYPYILLNLILSCVASIQAPLILMSQNRMAEIDRQRDNKAFEINSETKEQLLEISKRIDSFIYGETLRTIEIQNIVKNSQGSHIV